MVKHIVMFKLADNAQAKCEEAKKVLMGMVGKVPTAKSIDVHIDMLRSARSYDVMLEVTVDSWEKLDEYQHDGYHCSVVKEYMHKAASGSVAFDYEI